MIPDDLSNPEEIISSTEVDILFMDSDLLVINKPAGLLSIQDGYQIFLPHVRAVLEPNFGRLWIVHRLDKDTSGVMILARNKNTHRTLNIMFEHREVQKAYHAIICGNIPWKNITVDFPLLVNGDRRHRTVVSEKGKPARTDFSLIRQFGTSALISASPHTGYTHQIRAHAAFSGFPLIGDPLYSTGIVPSPPAFSRPALHASTVSLLHPVSRLPVLFSAPYPADFNRFIFSQGDIKSTDSDLQ